MATKKSSAVHSIRCTEDMWRAAKARAQREGHSMNYVIGEILEGYGKGYIDLPEVTKKYAPTRLPA